ncbi:T9SS type A sorting domain-containing protein [Neolewinella persica]|uniref:T9SS type A sorting domain-containing protein n=1 Tax=Neolewinella persica TaxID=70998 RepID=UPI00037C0A57|nr:T9SS type A sorting domain-containing protein [Neolewinella persica]
MQKIYLLVLLLMGLTLPAFAQNGIIGQGFANGFSNPADIGFFDDSFGGSRILITQSTGTGDQYFRMVRAWSGDNSEFAPQASCPANDQDVTALSGDVHNGVVSFGNCDKAFFINVPNTTDNYVFKTPSPTGTMEFIYFRIEGAIASIILTQQMPSVNGTGEVPADMDIEVASLADINVPTGQGVYLRYTTNGFATSTVIPMTVLCVGGNCTPFATIPGQPDGTTVTYYVFTSGDAVAPATDGSDADYRTINADTNGGANFSYTTSSVLPVTYTSFTGQRQKADVVDLTWSTATEDQAGFFTVECSVDQGRTWMDRATVSAQNRPDGAIYTFTDLDAPVVDLSYRLRQTDADASYQYSNIIPVPALQASVRIWPQPVAGDRVNLSVPGQYQGGEATLINTVGRKISTFVLNAGRQDFNIAGLPAGMYLLQLSAPGGEQTVRRVLVR